MDTENSECSFLATELDCAPFATRPEGRGAVYLEGDAPVAMTAD